MTQDMTEREAAAYESRILKGLRTLEKDLITFNDRRGWAALGYDSFTQWWDAKLWSVPLSQAIRQWAIHTMMEQAPRYGPDGRRQMGAVEDIAEALNTTAAAVQSSYRKTRARARVRATGRGPQDMVSLSFQVTNLWHSNIANFARTQDASMSDILRHVISVGMKDYYGVDVDARPKARLRRVA